MEERELLHTDGLSVGYHGRELIKEIGISLKMGEIVTLIGPNGAGKSTILKTIAKQLQEICGSVYVENINLSELPEKELAKKMSGADDSGRRCGDGEISVYRRTWYPDT